MSAAKRRAFLPLFAALLIAGFILTAPAPGPVPQDGRAEAVKPGPLPSLNDFACKVLRVVDGDTVILSCAGPEVNARLIGFDTPETFRSGCALEKDLGQQATRHLETLLRSAKSVVPELHGADRYRRLLLRLVVDGKPLEAHMVEAGLAVPYEGGKRIDWCKKLAGV